MSSVLTRIPGTEPRCRPTTLRTGRPVVAGIPRSPAESSGAEQAGSAHSRRTGSLTTEEPVKVGPMTSGPSAQSATLFDRCRTGSGVASVPPPPLKATGATRLERAGTVQKELRLRSLDVLRGFTIAAMVLVNNPGDSSFVHPPLRHADWN